MTEIVVTSERRNQPKLLHTGNIERIDAGELAWVQHQHISESLGRVAGTWIVRGSGQDHQTSIRSPVLGGAGSCGGFLILEDGIPTRPSGFCNTNQLIEVNAEQAQSIEVIRGPANALFGSNALHGVVNVLMPEPADAGHAPAGIEFGANDYVRVRAALPFAGNAPWIGVANYADDGGFRESSGYRQGKLHAKRSWGAVDDRFTLAMTVTALRQETAGFITGEDAYKSELVSETNPNPEAYRDADSLRLYGIWTRQGQRTSFDIRPYLRRSSMDFLHHALPGQPGERNGQVSAGLITAVRLERNDWHTVTGLDLEWSDVYLQQTQAEPAAGPPAQQATRPVGKHYDYTVDALVVAPFIQSEYRINDDWSVGGGVRFEYARYDYDNRMLSGNTRDDGSECGFGGCLYSRPEDRSDSFRNVAPNLSARYRISDRTVLFGRLTRGFRAPQTLELYRLQNGQEIADLDSEYVDSLEFGLRTDRYRTTMDVTAFAMRKRNSVFRDSEGFNVTGARSKHVGVEADIDVLLAPRWQLSANTSYARHTYDFTAAGRGENFIAGNDIDTAPRWLGSVELAFEPFASSRFGLQVTHVGEYYLDSANAHDYAGHTLVNLRMLYEPASRYALILRINNLLDTRYADRADFAGRDYRYLPGRSREAYLEIRFLPRP
ncbi:MAG: TonB-dependent receptor [Woeseiaceae bacterium]|nr:TonB-dependent receptor [Woeseiaceae bacterium]